MKIRHLFSVLSVFTMVTVVGLAGEQPKLTGGPCNKGEPESQVDDGSQKHSDPIYMATGDFQHVNTDLFIPGRGLDFEIKRFYRSKTGLYSTFSTDPGSPHDGVLGDDPRVKTPLGINWDFNYNLRVSLEGGGVVSYESPDPEPVVDDIPPNSIYFYTGTGRRDEFRRYTSNFPVSSAESYASDEYAAIFKYARYNLYITMIDSNQVTYLFHPFYDGYGNILPYAGRVYSITDRNGNGMTFTYETSTGSELHERLASVTDTLGHITRFYYHDDSGSPLSGLDTDYTAHLVWRIEELHSGRVVEYEYSDVDGGYTAKLVKATLPSIVDTPDFDLSYSDNGLAIDHGRFPNGRVWAYEYAPQGTGWFDDGLITKITNPNGVIITQNEYSTETFDERRSGRVIRQQFGDEFYNYVVTDTYGGITNTGDSYDYYVWVNGRKGVITRFKYARDRNSYNDQPGQPDVPRDRQLLEKTEFLGFVANPDQRVWAECDGNGNPATWKYFDINGNPQTLALGPIDENGQPGQMLVTTYEPDRNWNIVRTTFPNGGSSGQTYQNHDVQPLPGQYDPRFNKAVTSRTVTSPDGLESITEYWRYDAEVGGGGCGCGSAGFETAYQDGNGNVTRKTYDDWGNMLAVYRGLPSSYFTDTLPAAVVNDAASIEEYVYNQWGQVVTHTHPEKIILDAQGNEITHNRVDQFEYYSNTADLANYGRLHRKRIDANGFDLTTTYEYDLIGNVIKEVGPYDGTDPNGLANADVTEYLYNQASQLVRVEHFDGAQNLFAEKMYFYDANGNIVVEEEKNLDGDQNLVVSNKWFTTVRVYDELDFRTETSREKNTVAGLFSSYAGAGLKASSQAANADYVTQRWIYDAHRNVTKFEAGEAVNGSQASNAVTHEYDARDLLVKTVQGAGGTSPLTTAFIYDDNGRPEKQVVNPDDPYNLQETLYVYDGFDRVQTQIDPMGNEYFYEYDDNHNVLSVVACGPILEDDSLGTQPQVTLAKVSCVYDGLDRYTSTTLESFEYDYSDLTGNGGEACEILPLSSTQQTTNYVYNDDSSVRRTVAPSGHATLLNETRLYYDTASRLEFREDAAGNMSQSVYDADSNLLSLALSDISSQGSGIELYSMQYEYDAMDRQTASIDGVGNRTESKYDSRSNVVERKDAKGTISTYTYDALGRPVDAVLAGMINESKIYDNTSRLLSETDDNGNTTSYEYDGMNRLIKTIMPDNKFYEVAYDANGNPATYTDARGVVITQSFDLNNRLIGRTINDAAVSGGILGAKSETYTYDGLGRLRIAENDFARVTREYDSRSNVLREIQNADSASDFASVYDREVSYSFDLAGNNISLVYPSGRQIFRTYDELNRLKGIFNDALLAGSITEFEYIGQRPLVRIHGNGLKTNYSYNGYQMAVVEPNDFGFGRVNKITTSKVSTSEIVDAFTFTWDRNQSRAAYKDVGSGMKNRRERTFGYDSANRLISTDVDFPDPLTDFTAPANNGITTYALDGVHNRTAVSGFEGSGAPIGAYSQSGNQAANNQYSLMPRESGGEWSYMYDENGNMVIKAQNSAVDYNGDYSVNFFDFSVFNTAYANGDMSADHNGDGVLDYFDVTAFLQDFGPANGTDLEHWSYTYDFRNQLVGISQGLGASVLSTTTNTYNPLARRVLESTDSGSKQMVYGGVSYWDVIEQIDLSGASEQVLTTHVYGLGIDDEVSYRLESFAIPEDIWSHRDDLNSLTSISDSSGEVKERYEYGDYGEVQMFDASGLAISVSAYSVQHLYTGRSLISGSGFYDYRFRAMAPEIGRFVQRDPLWSYDSLNLYQYTLSTPASLVDSYGLAGGGVFTTPPGGGGGVDYSSPGLQDLHYIGPSDSGQNNKSPIPLKGTGTSTYQLANGARKVVDQFTTIPLDPTFYYTDVYIEKMREGLEDMANDVGLCKALQNLDDQPGSGVGQGGVVKSSGGNRQYWKVEKNPTNGMCYFVSQKTKLKKEKIFGIIPAWWFFTGTTSRALIDGIQGKECPASSRDTRCGADCKKWK